MLGPYIPKYITYPNYAYKLSITFNVETRNNKYEFELGIIPLKM